jgi:hypothetical protein
MTSCSHRWLKSGREQGLARTAVSFRFAVKVREHDLMREVRRPFKGVGTISVGATEEFMLAVVESDEFGVAELADDLFAIPFWNEVL